MKTIGIKLADGSFYPIFEENEPNKATLELTTANDDQTTAMVDLYRSESGSMENAEFVKTIQLDNLIKHPNGETSISFSLELDENKNLLVDMNDKESGSSSGAKITLGDSLLNDATEAALNMDFGDLPDFDDEDDSTTESGGIADGTNDATEAALNMDFGDLPDFDDEDDSTTESGGIADGANDATEAALNMDFGDLPDFDDEDAPTETSGIADGTNDATEAALNMDFGDLPDFDDEDDSTTESGGIADGTNDATEAALNMDFGDLPDFDDEDAPTETSGIADGANDATEAALSMDFGDLPDFDDEDAPTESGGIADGANDATEAALNMDFGDLPDLSDDTITLDNTEEDAFIVPDVQEEAPSDDATEVALNMDFGDLPDFDDDTITLDNTEEDAFIFPDVQEEAPSDDATEAALNMDFGDLPDFDDEDDSTTESGGIADGADFDESLPDLDSLAKDISDLPDFSADLPNFADDTSEELSDKNFDDDFADMNFDDIELPNSASADDINLDDFDLPTFASTDTKAEDLNDFDFSLDFDEPTNRSDLFSQDANFSSGLNFDGLYDKETIEGKSSMTDYETTDSIGSRTKVPVIICILCAIICILATVFVLFVIPSKYNLIPSRNTRNSIITTQDNYTTERSSSTSNAYQYQAETPIYIERVPADTTAREPEKIIPQQPVAPSPRPADIVYKVKWGDTLWDIASTYYRNPWRYKMIAQYNGIRNPDYILSGQVIRLPSE